MRVLLVEDDQMLGSAVLQALHDASYAVDWVQDGAQASVALTQHEFGLILLDLGLPNRDGLEVLRRLRASGDATPVLIITARDTVDERIEGLDIGADDYLGKPFAVGELLARLRALMRRNAGATTSVLTNGIVSLELAAKLAVVDGIEYTLSNREFALLQALMLRPGAVLSRGQLEQTIYGWGEEVESNAVDVIIHGLRRKLGPDRIRNVRGLGWMVERAHPTTGAGDGR
ncbi:MAG: response regulator [Pseudomonadota bacterium]|nr:response regulator [Pseudomonadota bacterium]